VRTDFLSKVNMTQREVLGRIALFNRWATSFSIVSYPQDVATAGPTNLASSDVWLESVAYVHRGVPWVPRFLAGTAIMQPIEAQSRAGLAAEVIGGIPNQSKPNVAVESPTNGITPESLRKLGFSAVC
jgi:hypothetical protein